MVYLQEITFHILQRGVMLAGSAMCTFAGHPGHRILSKVDAPKGCFARSFERRAPNSIAPSSLALYSLQIPCQRFCSVWFEWQMETICCNR